MRCRDCIPGRTMWAHPDAFPFCFVGSSTILQTFTCFDAACTAALPYCSTDPSSTPRSFTWNRGKRMVSASARGAKSLPGRLSTPRRRWTQIANVQERLHLLRHHRPGGGHNAAVYVYWYGEKGCPVRTKHLQGFTTQPLACNGGRAWGGVKENMFYKQTILSSPWQLLLR